MKNMFSWNELLQLNWKGAKAKNTLNEEESPLPAPPSPTQATFVEVPSGVV